MSPEEGTVKEWLHYTPGKGWRFIPIAILQEPRNTSLEHTEIMVFLLGYLRRELRVQDLNWAHVDIPDRKADLPLKIHGKPYDIVFGWKGKVVALEVDVYSPESIT
jgi:hypothetical protein